MTNPNFELLRHDVTFPLYIEVDEIYNLAAPASPIYYQKDPVQTTKTIVHGAINMLGLAKRTKAKILQASTSEVYGNPQEHPQTEEYWGNVNPIGIRSCYDEGKRCAETLFFDYYRQNNVPIRVVRIFNSLTGDQKVIYYKNGILKYKKFIDCYDDIKNEIENIIVPCFGKDNRYVLSPISGIHKHKVTKNGYELFLTWGKQIKLTEDHGVFILNKNQKIKEKFVKDLVIGDIIAIPNQIKWIDIPLMPFKISNILKQDFNFYVSNDDDLERIINNKYFINKCKQSGVGLPSTINNFKRVKRIKSSFLKSNNIILNSNDYIVLDDSKHIIKNNINIMEEFLWFLGFYVAEGSLVNNNGGDYQLHFYSDLKYLQKLNQIIYNLFELETKIYSSDTKPHICIRSKIIFELVTKYFEFGIKKQLEKIIPDWIIQLPKDQLKWFLLGFWEGDGNHDAKTTGNKLIFSSSSINLIDNLNLILLKFGIIGSTCCYYTTCSKDNPKLYKGYLITVQGLSHYDISRLDTVVQKLQRKKNSDIQWAHIKDIKKFDLIEENVYDFSVKNFENFIGGDLISCHNTYGPNMKINDGRVVSNFIVQALTSKPITIYGNGKQTRSFCYISDTVNGLISMMEQDKYVGPINLGNPEELKIVDVANLIVNLTESDSKLEFKSLPLDDPTRRKPDISLAKEILKWRPKVNFKEGLQYTIKYFKDTLGR